MRKFTRLEENIIKELIKWSSNGQSIRLGEILLKLFPIEYIKQSPKKEDKFYKHTIEICYNEKKVQLSAILEAINLFDLLVKQNYIVAKEFFATKCIGEESEYMQIATSDVHYVIETVMNYYNYDLWDFLCNHFYVTNALIDFSKDFKTPEQRRHKCSTHISIFAILISFFVGITSPFITKYSSDESNKENLERLIIAIQEQKSISIDKFPNIMPDTLKIKITDKSDKQPINLNVTVKPDQPIHLK